MVSKKKGPTLCKMLIGGEFQRNCTWTHLRLISHGRRCHRCKDQTINRKEQTVSLNGFGSREIHTANVLFLAHQFSHFFFSYRTCCRRKIALAVILISSRACVVFFTVLGEGNCARAFSSLAVRWWLPGSRGLRREGVHRFLLVQGQQ